VASSKSSEISFLVSREAVLFSTVTLHEATKRIKIFEINGVSQSMDFGLERDQARIHPMPEIG
jgi:hypothetical protein